MPRRRPSESGPAPPTRILTAEDIEPNRIYRPSAIIAALGLKKSTLRTAWRKGQLRIVRIAGKNFLLGKDIFAWLDGSELPSPARRPERSGAAH